MNLNHLLFWASALGSGSWYSFRCAVERLDLVHGQSDDDQSRNSLPLYQRARFGLERLGHVEFFGKTAEWRIVPPSLAVVQQDDHVQAILCGARSEPLLASIDNVFRDTLLSRLSCEDSPDVISIVQPDTARIEAAAQRLSIAVQLNAPETILLNHPPLGSLIQWPKTEMPFGEGWTKEKFCVRTLSWQKSSDASGDTTGTELLRFTQFGRHHYFVRVGQSGIKVPGQMGKFFLLMLCRRRVIAYDRWQKELRVPPICRPPLLVERALCLCSGFLSSFEPENNALMYRDIPDHVAQLTANVLRQVIQ